MPKATTTDISLTISCIPKVSKIPGISPTIAKLYKPIENRNIYEGRVVDQAYYKSYNIERFFTNIRFNFLFQINEPIVPRFILDFYSQVTWDLVSLEYSQETEGPYCTDLPTPDNIRQLLELERVMVDITIKSQTVALNPNQILTKKLSPDMKQREELIRENVFGLGGPQDRHPACLAHIATPTANLLYGMFLTRLYRYVMETNLHLDNGTYDIVERVMRTSSHQHDDDDDVETSRATFISKASKRLKINIIPPKQLFVDLTQENTKTSSPKIQLSSPSAPNAPSKTPSTKDTSSSSIDYTLKSPTLSLSPSTNGYLNPLLSLPPRVPPPPPPQET
nr:hypothetical protein [Tanacetum cinerariifolium]